MKLKYLPNYLSILRIIASVFLLFIDIYSFKFVFIYILCGMTDILDGYIARKMKMESLIGAKIDTIADIIMFIVILYLFIPIIYSSYSFLILWIIIIAIIRVSSMMVNFYKYHTFGSVHTYANKIAGLIVFLTPILFNYIPILALGFFTCIIAIISAIEELIICITSKEFLLNKKGLFI